LVQTDQHAGDPHHYGTNLSGEEEVPVRDTLARGQATFHLNDDGTELRYKLNIANIENVLQAHIHLAAASANGSITAWLYPSAPPAQLIPGRSQGTLNEGVITSASLWSGRWPGRPSTPPRLRMQAGVRT
jgi:hypothetical protein